MSEDIFSTAHYHYELPEELIAQEPVQDRSSSRLMVMDRRTGVVSHHVFNELGNFLRPGDCLVMNNTRVIPARLLGTKKDTHAAAEILLLKRLDKDKSGVCEQFISDGLYSDSCLWECLARPGKKLRPGAVIEFGPVKSADGSVKPALSAVIREVTNDGNRIAEFFYSGIWEEVLDTLGEMPLPPYIKKKLPREDKERYQTVYAKHDGSAAAPTAGLHFTDALLKNLEDSGIKTAFVTLHVGLGTFRPVKSKDVRDHHMHTESCEITEETADILNKTREAKGRVVCVGTTSVRTLESLCDDNGMVKAGRMDTDIFIYPGYSFKCVDGLITNFHLPESTLIMLVSAFAGRDRVLSAYSLAVKEKYRFFSFGDAMMIL